MPTRSVPLLSWFWAKTNYRTKRAKLKNMETGEQIEIALDETFEDKFDDIAVQYMFHDIVEDF